MAPSYCFLVPVLKKIPFPKLGYFVNFSSLANHMSQICYLIFLRDFDSVTFLTYQRFGKEISHNCDYTHLSISLLFCLYLLSPAP